MTKRRTIFQVISFEHEYLVVTRPSVAFNHELIRMSLHTLSDEFKNKVSTGLVDWIEGVYFVAKLEKVPGFTSPVYYITDVEEDIFPVPSWQELFLGGTK